MGKKEKYVAFRDEEEIIELIDDERLAEMNFFSDKTKKALGALEVKQP